MLTRLAIRTDPTAPRPGRQHDRYRQDGADPGRCRDRGRSVGHAAWLSRPERARPAAENPAPGAPAGAADWLYHADLLGARGALARPCDGAGVEHPLLGIDRLQRGAAGAEPVLADARRRRGELARPGSAFTSTRLPREGRWEHIPNGIDTSELRPDAAARRRLRAALGIAEDMVAIGLPARYHLMKGPYDLPRRRGRTGAAAIRGAVPSGRRRDRARQSGTRSCHCGARADPPGAPARRTPRHGGRLSGVRHRRLVIGVWRRLAQCHRRGHVVRAPRAATDSGDTAEIVGRTGLVVPPRNAPALAAAWERLAALGPDGRRALGASARERIVRHYARRDYRPLRGALRRDFQEKRGAPPARLRARLSGQESATSEAGAAPRSRTLRACHSVAGSSSSRNCTSPPASSATGSPSR